MHFRGAFSHFHGRRTTQDHSRGVGAEKSKDFSQFLHNSTPKFWKRDILRKIPKKSGITAPGASHSRFSLWSWGQVGFFPGILWEFPPGEVPIPTVLGTGAGWGIPVLIPMFSFVLEMVSREEPRAGWGWKIPGLGSQWKIPMENPRIGVKIPLDCPQVPMAGWKCGGSAVGAIGGGTGGTGDSVPLPEEPGEREQGLHCPCVPLTPCPTDPMSHCPHVPRCPWWAGSASPVVPAVVVVAQVAVVAGCCGPKSPGSASRACTDAMSH